MHLYEGNDVYCEVGVSQLSCKCLHYTMSCNRLQNLMCIMFAGEGLGTRLCYWYTAHEQNVNNIMCHT